MNRIKKIQAMIRQIIDLIEEDRKVHLPDSVTAFAPTSDLFMTFTSGGHTLEGETIEVWCTTEERALKMLFKQLISYKHKHPGVIYWRARPALHVVNFLRPLSGAGPLAIHQETSVMLCPLYYGWCRLMISDGPIMEPIELEKHLEKLKGGRSIEQPVEDTHRDPPLTDEGRGDGKLEGN